MSVCASNQLQRRLGTRVRAQIPVRVTSIDPETTFSENCHTLLVNPQGCGVRCSQPLKTGLEVRLDDLPGRGSARAKVASIRRFDDQGKYWIVGIALESPGNLWCIAPAPDDWGPFSPPSRFLPESVKFFSNNTSLPSNIRAGKA